MTDNTDNLEPSRPIDAYRAIIDQLVLETSHGVTEKSVLQRGAFLETSECAVYNPFLQSLSAEQRKMLTQMLHAERFAAIHDVLALSRGGGKRETLPLHFGAKQCQ